MATITDLDDLMRYLAQEAASMTLDEFRVAVVGELRRRHPGEKIYIPAPDTSKREAIERAVRTMPTAVVAERYGVTQSYAYKVMKRGVSKKS